MFINKVNINNYEMCNYACLLAYLGIICIDSRTDIYFQTSRFIITARGSFSRRPVDPMTLQSLYV